LVLGATGDSWMGLAPEGVRSRSKVASGRIGMVSPRFSPRSLVVLSALALTALAAACGGEGDTTAAGDRFETETVIADSVGAIIDGRQVEVHRDPG